MDPFTKERVERMTLPPAIIIVMVLIVCFIVGFLFVIWNSGPETKVYQVIDVKENISNEYPKCPDDKYITIVKNPQTNKITYKCGELGTNKELVYVKE